MVILKDVDGHRYRIPEELVESFNNMKLKIQSCEEYSDSWYDANDDFNEQFQNYMVS